MVNIIHRALKSKIAAKVASVFVSNGLRQILALSISVFVARVYGATGRGEYALFSSVTMVIALVCSLGLINALIYKLKKADLSLKQAAFLLFTHSTVAIFLVFVVVAVVKTVENTFLLEIGHPIWVLSVLFFLYYQGTYLNLLLTSHFLASGNVKNHRRLMVMTPVVTFAILFFGYSLLGEDRFHPVPALVAGELITAIVFLLSTIKWEDRTLTERLTVKEIYSFALRSYLTGLTGTAMTKLDNLVLGAYSGVDAVGFYAAAKSLAQVIQSVPTAFSGYLFGLFVERGVKEGRGLVLKSTSAIFFLTMCVSFPLFMVPSWILDFVYGSEFMKVTAPLMLLAAAAIVAGTSNPILSFLNANNRPGASSLASLISATLTVVLLFVLVPSMSYVGAAYATLAGSLSIFVLRCGLFLRCRI